MIIGHGAFDRAVKEAEWRKMLSNGTNSSCLVSRILKERKQQSNREIVMKKKRMILTKDNHLLVDDRSVLEDIPYSMVITYACNKSKEFW